jgi:hypothetical protein
MFGFAVVFGFAVLNINPAAVISTGNPSQASLWLLCRAVPFAYAVRHDGSREGLDGDLKMARLSGLPISNQREGQEAEVVGTTEIR